MRFLLIWYFIIINVFGMQIMKNDKKRAIHHQRRISEKNLWMVALIGGAPGTFIGMKMYRHKTKHFQFKYGFPILAIIDLLIYFYLFTLVS
ncbi:DUF1294 domain-containing protein [Bacillus sp. FJAT-49732]|uniref:DUF1294 domain-containing protein n=1 Tax=Lederbergia citrisecunda TaxID=2833583 RepID=A0A942TLS2_9BACI|nr:DUF1294 domain-containing protein [Lederbergia citrisecunda]MBS4199930.1 DUF1294 domain-containing protein [Lederbergia citrisecunda]